MSQLSIVDKQADTVRFEPNWAQQELLREVHRAYDAQEPCRIIVLKSRQLGVSTLSGALAFSWTTLFPNINAFVVAHTAGSTIYLFDKLKFFYETWPLRGQYPTRYSSRREMVFSSNNSSLRVQTAKSDPDALRGRTINFAHLSELAFWDKQAEAMVALRSAMPHAAGTVLIAESTANGAGNWWHDTWLAAEAGKVDFVPFFFPWWRHHEYIPCHGVGCRDCTCEICEKMSHNLRPVGEEEKRLYKLGASPAHLAWRRWAIPNVTYGSEDYFLQEFPAAPEDAFLLSGVNVFPPSWLDRVYERQRPTVGSLRVNGRGDVEFEADPHGPLRVYKPPGDKAWGAYFIGADPAYGVIGGDLAAAQVINRQTKEQVAVWHGRINPIPFADECVKLARWYNDATIAPEASGPGQAMVGRLVSLYPNLWHHTLIDRVQGRQRSEYVVGFGTNWQRKQWLVAQLSDMVQREGIVLHDEATYNEMKSYSFYGSRGDVYAPGDDGHDDLVMALGIAVVCESTETPPPPYQMRPQTEDQEIVYGEKVDLEDFLEGWA